MASCNLFSYLFISRWFYLSAQLLLQHLIPLTWTHLTQTDLSPCPRKVHQVTGNIFKRFYSAVESFVELNRQIVLFSMHLFVRSIISTSFSFLILALRNVSSFLKRYNCVNKHENIFTLSLHILVKCSVLGRCQLGKQLYCTRSRHETGRPGQTLQTWTKNA
jgi:hypothetical protein